MGNYENKILNLTALNYSKSHGLEGVIGREVENLSVQLNNYLVRTPEWTLPSNFFSALDSSAAILFQLNHCEVVMILCSIFSFPDE